MDANDKTAAPEDEREISLNETSLKKPLGPIDVIGGHGPWQFRLWIVFLAASLCNATIAFTALFLPSQSYCFSEKLRHIRVEKSSLLGNNSSASSSQMRVYVKNNSSADNGCNGTDCSKDIMNTNISSAKPLYEFECWNSQVEIFVRFIYIVACLVSFLIVYFATKRFGRRPLALVSCLFLVASSLGMIWADTSAIFLILRFIVSLGVFNIYLTSAFSLMDYVHKDFKFLYFFTGHVGWNMAHFLLPVVALLAQNWMSFNIALSVGAVILSCLVWWGPESPSSFPKESEINRARKTLKYAAFINGYSTTNVDLLSHNFRSRQENKHDLGSLSSSKAKFLCFTNSFILFVISFTTSFIYFATKWHPEWFKVDSSRISFSFLGTTDVAATIILLFLTCIIAIKYLWAIVSIMTSVLMILIFSRTKGGASTSSAKLFIVVAFFASASWTLLLARSFCYKISNVIVKFNTISTIVAVSMGSLAASTIILTRDNQNMLLILAIPHLLAAIATCLVPEAYIGTVS